jgi:hypothetical protein
LFFFSFFFSMNSHRIFTTTATFLLPRKRKQQQLCQAQEKEDRVMVSVPLRGKARRRKDVRQSDWQHCQSKSPLVMVPTT